MEVLMVVVCALQSAGLSNFAWGHTCSRQDTLSGLAVKYGVTPLAIKMTNNLISDIGLQSRHIIYVPGDNADVTFQEQVVLQETSDRPLRTISDILNASLITHSTISHWLAVNALCA